MTVSPQDGGDVQIDGATPGSYPVSQTIAVNQLVTLKAIAGNGYNFVGWSGSLTGTENPASVDMTCPKNITASFAKKEEVLLTLAVSGSGGTVTPAPGNHAYHKGTVVNLFAIPNRGFRFDGWTGSVADATSNNTTVTMDASQSITARFSAIVHTLTIGMSGKGTVTPSPGDHQVTEGSILRIIATPDEGHRFDGWTGNVADSTSNNTTVTMDASRTVIANFAPVPPAFPTGAVVKGGLVLAVLIAGGGAWWAIARRKKASKPNTAR